MRRLSIIVIAVLLSSCQFALDLPLAHYDGIPEPATLSEAWRES